MNHSHRSNSSRPMKSVFVNRASRITSDDGHLAKALEDYLLRCESRSPPDRAAFLQEYAEIADSLRMALDGLEFVNLFAPQLQDHSNDASFATTGLQPSAPLRLGDFEIIRELGRGGMGIVYEAEQQMLGHRWRIKVLPFAVMMDERQQSRFRNEARAAATLNHPGIVPVYAVGVERGVHYYAMQYVEGQSLAATLNAIRGTQMSTSPDIAAPSRQCESTAVMDQACLSTIHSQNRPDYFRAIARLGIEVAKALQHAHRHGVIHRDIKPANIMVGTDGHAMITDFGLARLEGGTELTLTGDVIGTLRYAPPEQVLGQQEVVDERADIYSLGVTLYEAIALRHPFDAKNREALLRQITGSNPAGLRTLDRSIPPDLETIIHRAMEADPADRFSSAAEMGEELERYLEHRPLKSRRPLVPQRIAKWTRRILGTCSRHCSSSPWGWSAHCFEPGTWPSSIANQERTRYGDPELGNRR